MGRDKTRLPWISGQPLLHWMLGEFAVAGWQPLVVLGPHNWDQRDLPIGTAVLNAHPENGKTSSLAAGARALPPNARAILVTSIDQPRPRAIHTALRESAAARSDRIFVPDRHGHRGHPVVLPGAFRERLLALDESSEGLRGLLDAHEAQTVRLPGLDPEWLEWDLNTPADYEAARKHFALTAT